MKYVDFIDIIVELFMDYEEKEEIRKDDKRLGIITKYTKQGFDRWNEEDIYFYIGGMYDLLVVLEQVLFNKKEKEECIVKVQQLLSIVWITEKG